MFFIKNSCPVCQTGILGIRRCADGQNLVVMCDECETVWISPELISTSNALDAPPPAFEVAELGIAIAGGSSEWASHEEIATKGWRTISLILITVPSVLRAGDFQSGGQ